jgi:two-component system sensor histidine kinase UhpB
MKTEKTTKVLILEHDPNDIELLQYELKKGGINLELAIVENGDAFGNALTQFNPDIILSDYSLPSFDGVRAFQLKQQVCPDVPFIIVSGTIGEENAVELIKNGVTDYVLKDKLFTVVPKIKRALKEASERREKAQAEMNMRRSERRLAEAQVITKIGSWEINQQGDLIACSDVMYAMLGLQPGDPLSYQIFLGFIHPDDTYIITKVQDAAMNTGRFEPVVFRIITKQGEEKYIEGRGALRKDDSNISFIGTCQDITEKVKAELQLKAYSEQIVKERVEHQRKLVRASIEGQEKERAEIGRELHDNINQILAVTKAYVDAALHEDDKLEELLQRSLKNLDRAIQEIRRISKSLVPPAMDKNGLVDSVNDLIDTIRVVNPFAINFKYEKEKLRNLSDQQQLALYRIVQEQFNNIIKHAEARKVLIELTGNNDLINLMISDDGKGFDPKAKRQGVGLSNMLSRIELFDGKLDIITSKGTGCTLKVRLPKEHKAATA